MRDDTAKINAVEPLSAQERLRQIRQEVINLDEAMRVQQAAMRSQAVGLPQGALERTRTMLARLDGLAETLLARQTELRQLRALAETTALINSALDTDTVLAQVMDTVIQLTGAERGFIMLRNKATGALEFRVARGIDREQLGRDDFTISNTIVNEVATTGEPVLTDNARSDPRYRSQESIVGYQLRSILAVPLRVRDEVIGVVYCDNRVLTGLFKETELNLLKAFANQGAVAIQNARLFDATRAQLAEISEMRDLMDNIFTSIASGLITLDSRGDITLFNPAAELITRQPVPKVIGMPLDKVLPDFSAAIGDLLTRVRQDGTKEAVEVEMQIDGETRYWNVLMSPLPDIDGASQGVALLLDDLTEKREHELQMTQVRRYLPPALVENLRSADLSVLNGQEREITVVFADVRGFTAFSERLEPEQLMEIINKYLSVASDSINLFEGVVANYMGDAVTGLFNTQLNPQDDHALRGVRSALSMIYDVLALHEVLPEEQRLYYGIGIHTGKAVLGNAGGQERREFTAIGDAVELSKLLQENAHRGEIILSAATYEQIKDHFECEPLAPRVANGHDDLTIIYKLTGRKRKES